MDRASPKADKTPENRSEGNGTTNHPGAIKSNMSSVEAEIHALIRERCLEDYVIIYTDGSVIRHVRSSWALTARFGGRVIHEDSGASAVTTSSLTMEMRAVTMALSWLETQSYRLVCFLSGSMNMIVKLETGMIRREWLASFRLSKLLEIQFIFVPAHAGVLGNKRADRLAGMAVVGDGKAMDRSDILHALSDAARKNDFDDKLSTSINRLFDLGVVRGVARRECFAGCQRRLVNQHRTGVASRYTLADTLRGRSEHMWICPLCNDDRLSNKLNSTKAIKQTNNRLSAINA